MPFGLGKSEKQAVEEAEPESGVHSAKTIAADSPVAAVMTEERAPSRSATAPTAPAATPPPTGDAFFVSITRQDSFETRRFDSSTDVQTFVEALLEEGVPEEEVTVFSGHRLALRVSHRPVVKLNGAQED